MPWLERLKGGAASARVIEGRVICVEWRAPDVHYRLLANVSATVVAVKAKEFADLLSDDASIFEIPEGTRTRLAGGDMEPWSGVFALDRADRSKSS